VATVLPERPVPKRPRPRNPAPRAELEDRVLYWPDCGHALDDDAVLYDRPVCVHCDAAAGER
jgi:hypothetical protein